MQSDRDKIPVSAPSVKPFNIYKALIPVVVGIVVIVWLFLNEFDTAVFSTFQFTFVSLAFIFLAFLLMALRDFTLICRFRILADKQISLKQSFVVNVMSEFTSTVTPTAIGGSSLVALFLAQEGVEVGRSITITLVNLFLDELFFVVLCPVLFLVLPLSELFPASAGFTALYYVFSALYVFHLIWTILLYVGIFVRPDWVKKILLKLFKLPFLRRWQNKILIVTDNLIRASHDIQHRNFAYWLKVCILTFITWTARFFVANAIFSAFVSVDSHLLVYARQVILWIFMAIMPTPGGSGMSEFTFKEYYGDICSSASIVLLVTLIWRIVSYYVYLLLGILVVPKWLHKAFAKKNASVSSL